MDIEKTTLYRSDNKGALRFWSIEAAEFELIFEFGQVGGEIQEQTEFVDEGLGGRTREEQLMLRYKSRLNKKRDKGYTEDREKAASGVVVNSLGFKRQSKAKLLKDGDTPSCFWGEDTWAQRKYNGHRCTFHKSDGDVFAFSSGGKLITSVDHICDEIEINEGQYLDGELYIHGLSLQKIGSKVRKKNKTDTDIKFVMFDQMTDDRFIDRYNGLPEQHSKHIIISDTINVTSWEQVKKLFFQFRAEKYEGLILRHGTTGYGYNQDRKGMYKIKKLQGEGYYDDEFKVVDIVSSTEGWAILVCESVGGLFKVSAHGTTQQKTKILHEKEKHIGRMVKVEYPELTDSGKPSQPIAIDWRESHE